MNTEDHRRIEAIRLRMDFWTLEDRQWLLDLVERQEAVAEAAAWVWHWNTEAPTSLEARGAWDDLGAALQRREPVSE